MELYIPTSTRSVKIAEIHSVPWWRVCRWTGCFISLQKEQNNYSTLSPWVNYLIIFFIIVKYHFSEKVDFWLLFAILRTPYFCHSVAKQRNRFFIRSRDLVYFLLKRDFERDPFGMTRFLLLDFFSPRNQCRSISTIPSQEHSNRSSHWNKMKWKSIIVGQLRTISPISEIFVHIFSKIL